MKKQTQLFLTIDDERRLSSILKTELSGIKFLNGNVWEEKPDVRDGIENCDSGIAYLFVGEISAIPAMLRKDGRLEGPVAGCVVQVLRPMMRDDVLLSGRVAVGLKDDDPYMKKLVTRIWKCVMKVGRLGVVRPDGGVDRNYLVGKHARELTLEKGLKIGDRAVGMLYEPASS